MGRAFFILGAILNSSGTDIRKPKERGEWAELRFMAKAAELGFKLSKPWGDSAPFDVVLWQGHHFVRIQVKSTMCKARARKPHHQQGAYTANLRRISARRYRKSDFDFVVVYVIPLDIWYILPSRVATSRTAVRVVPGDKRNPYERYNGAWHLLQEFPRPSRRGITIHAGADDQSEWKPEEPPSLRFSSQSVFELTGQAPHP